MPGSRCTTTCSPAATSRWAAATKRRRSTSRSSARPATTRRPTCEAPERASEVRKALGAAALGCGIFFSAAATGGEILPDAGTIPSAMVQRLLLVDARRIGERIVAVGDHGYIVLSDDGGKSWRRAKAPAAPLLTGVDFLDSKQGLAVGHDGTILETGDGGETWTQRLSDTKAQGPLL